MSRLSELWQEYLDMAETPSKLVCEAYNVDTKQEALNSILSEIKEEEELLLQSELEEEDEKERIETESDRREHCHQLGLCY